MATKDMAAMLDELMGRNRNYDPNDKNAKEIRWSDSGVCRFYLVEFCPHELFTNTKADLGPCEKIHDEELKTKFKTEATGSKKGYYEDDFLRFCQRMLQDLNSRIKKAKERLVLTQEREERMLAGVGTAPSAEEGGEPVTGATGGANKEVDEKIVLLSEKISALVQEAETAGCAGNVEQAQGLLKLSDQLRDEREALLRKARGEASSLGGPPTIGDQYGDHQKAMEVCEVCGAFLVIGDAQQSSGKIQQRIDDHLLGKQHVGYARLRAAYNRINDDKLKARADRDKEIEESRKAREEERKEREKKRAEERSKRKSRSRSRSRDRKRSRSRSRSRERRRRRSRSRSRSRDRRRSRSRDRRRSRSRSRSRDRRRRSRSRSRDRRRRSRSRSRDRRRRSRSR